MKSKLKIMKKIKEKHKKTIAFVRVRKGCNVCNAQ